MRRRDWLVVWPLYFDKRRSRSDGRRVSLELSVERPTIKDLAAAAERLGLEYVVEGDKRHPSTWFEESGRILVRKTLPKTKLLRALGRQLVAMRKSRGSRQP